MRFSLISLMEKIPAKIPRDAYIKPSGQPAVATQLHSRLPTGPPVLSLLPSPSNVAVELHDLRMMQQPIEHGDHQLLAIPEQ